MFLHFGANNKITDKEEVNKEICFEHYSNICSISFLSFHWCKRSNFSVWLMSTATHFIVTWA